MIDSPSISQADVGAVGAAVRDESPGYGLASLFSSQPQHATRASDLFKGSRLLKLAVLTRLLSRLRRVAVGDVDTLAASRALRVHSALSKSGALKATGSIGEWHVEHLLGPVLRAEFVSPFDLAELFGERDRESVKSTIEACRGACVLDALILSFIVVRLHGYSVPLTDLCGALRDVVEKESRA